MLSFTSQTETEPIFKIFSDNEVQKQLQTSRDHRALMQFLIENHDVRRILCAKFYKDHCNSIQSLMITAFNLIFLESLSKFWEWPF